MRVPRTDAGLVAAGSVVAALGVLVLPASLPALRTPFALALILVLPGGALSIAVRPAGILGGIERTLLGLGLSIAISILTALALNAVGISLRGPQWALSLMTVTLAACAIAQRRRRTRIVHVPRLIARRSEFGLAVLVAALLTAAVAIGTSPRALPDDVAGTTALWIVPADAGTVAVGVQSEERERTGYVLQIRRGRRVVREVKLKLAPGERSVTRVPVGTTDRRVSAVLSRAAQPGTPYRRVTLRLPATPLIGRR